MVFRPHPQLIPRFFNTNWFGPPPRVTGGSAWPRIDHPASGPPRRTRRAIRTRFRFGSATSGLTSRARGDSQAHYAKGMRSPQRGSRSLGAHDFRVSFTPLEGVLFTFPSRYSSTIGRRQYSALWDGPHGFGRGFTCPDLLGMRHENSGLRAWGCHPLRPDFPDGRARASLSFMPSRNPGGHVRRFGLVRFRSPLLAESLLISVPGLLRWFTSPSMAPCGYFIHRTGAGIAPCGLPHSDIRGSKGMCPSPRPFAACRVLLRLAAPQASAVDL